MMIDVEERQKRAEELFESGYNCCQAVVLAFSDLIPMSEEQIKAACCGFGGGFGRLREVCGAVSGMTMLTGFVGRLSMDPSDKAARTANYAMVQTLAEGFRKEKGSIVCRDLLGIRAGEHRESPTPSDRTVHYYSTRPCTANVGFAARLVAEKLAESSE